MPINITDAETLERKLSVIRNNFDKTHIVADFDGTLTQYFDHEKNKRPSIISVLSAEGVLGKEYTQKEMELAAIYYPIEYDHSLSLETRAEKMHEWRSKHNTLLLETGLKKSDLKRMAALNKIIQRDGTQVLFEKAKNLNIPLLVFSASSAGVDAIEALLTHRGVDSSKLDIIANDFFRDENDNLIGFSEQIIHSFNKEESVIRENPAYKSLQDKIVEKPNAIVFGDSTGDASMVKDRDDRIVLRIGLCNDKVDERLEVYQTYFDIVITGDDSLSEALKMIFG